MTVAAIVFAERGGDGVLRWGFRVGSVRAPLALMPPFAATADEAEAMALLFADQVCVAGPLLVADAGQDKRRAA